MPNYCDNQLEVSSNEHPELVYGFLKKNAGVGPSYQHYEFDPATKEDKPTGKYDEVTQSVLTFNKAVPVPQEICEAGFSPKGYDWNINHWGTKWDAFEVGVDVSVTMKGSDSCMNFWFETLWEGVDGEDFIAFMDFAIEHDLVESMSLVYNFTTAWSGAEEWFVMMCHNLFSYDKEYQDGEDEYYPDISIHMSSYEPGCIYERDYWYDGPTQVIDKLEYSEEEVKENHPEDFEEEEEDE